MPAEPLRLLLADDEPLALRRLRLALQAIPDVEIVGAANDGAQAIDAMRELRPDVVLLDIKMPLANGFEVANAIEESGGPTVIFVTAFDSYALRAFETSAVDYLLKPVEFERLASALMRARERRAAQSAGRRAEELASVLDALRRELQDRDGPRFEKEFWIRERGRFRACRWSMWSASKPSGTMFGCSGRAAPCSTGRPCLTWKSGSILT